MRKMKAAELVLDFDLYPRNNVDSNNVAYLVAALAAGVELPPVVIDRKTKRVVDGFHRVRAHLRHFGQDAEIEVIEKTYKSEGDLFLDAMRYNAGHGARLDPCDRTHCVIIAERLSIPLEAVAGALHMPVEKLGELRTHRTARGAGGLTVPIKRTVVPQYSGRKLTRAQEQANQKLSGMRPMMYVNQLILILEQFPDAIEDNEETQAGLQKLHGLLEVRVAAAA